MRYGLRVFFHRLLVFSSKIRTNYTHLIFFCKHHHNRSYSFAKPKPISLVPGQYRYQWLIRISLFTKNVLIDKLQTLHRLWLRSVLQQGVSDTRMEGSQGQPLKNCTYKRSAISFSLKVLGKKVAIMNIHKKYYFRRSARVSARPSPFPTSRREFWEESS